MKRILILLLVILIVSCSGSSESDDNSSNNLASIDGVWKLDRVEVLQEYYGFPLIPYVSTDSSIESCGSLINIVFDSDQLITYNFYNIVSAVDLSCELKNYLISDFTSRYLGNTIYKISFTYFDIYVDQTFEIRLIDDNLLEIKNIDGSSISYWIKT